MKLQELYLIYKNLIAAFKIIRTKRFKEEQIVSYYNNHIQVLINQLLQNENMCMDVIDLSNMTLDSLSDTSLIDNTIELLESYLHKLPIKQPEIVFLLTAPFDEEEKTGDGQYARSLIEGFYMHTQTQCFWIKEESLMLANDEQPNAYYKLPKYKHIKPIPEKTIPSVYVLQSVANQRTVISGYKVSSKVVLERITERVKRETTVRTPKIITNIRKKLIAITFYREGKVHLMYKSHVQKRMDKLRTKLDVLYRDSESKDNAIVLMEQAIALFQSLLTEFKNDSYFESELIVIFDKLSGLHEDNCYDINTDAVIRIDNTDLKNSFANHFNAAYEVAKHCPDRIAVVKNIKRTIQSIGQGKKVALDIHIRLPDTGVFFMPSDISLFKRQGMAVNITVHEYKQNYTRPYLQQRTHALLVQADSVLFFNEKDKSNAIRASISGNTDSKRDNNWSIIKYDLASKAHTTVASQVLSKMEQRSPELILAKSPNILCFGTIRSNKGFDVAIGIAQLIKKRVKNQAVAGIIPKVIIAGDPQSFTIMKKACEERFGKGLWAQYHNQNQYAIDDAASDARAQKIAYWNKALTALNINSHDLNNPYLEIIAWVDNLPGLKDQCKYVIRLDDMGMRNNGSGIISVLSIGLIYTKWGCVTDKEYQPGGAHANAIIMCDLKYGADNKAHKVKNYRKSTGKTFLDFYTKYNKNKRIESSYKRNENVWDLRRFARLNSCKRARSNPMWNR